MITITKEVKQETGYTLAEMELMALIPDGAINARPRKSLALALGLDPENRNDMRSLDRMTESIRVKGAPICASKRAPSGLFFPADDAERFQATAHYKAEIAKYQRLILVLENAPVPQK